MSRDRYGRPLRPPFDPDQVFPEVPQREVVSGLDAWAEAIAYLDDDLPFHAHEVFEQRWRCAPEVERACWRGLAQWGAARTHQARGNVVGAQRVAGRAADTLAHAEEVPSYVDLERALRECSLLADGT